MRKADKVIKFIEELKLDKLELSFLQGYLEFHTGLFSGNHNAENTNEVNEQKGDDA